MSIRSFQSKVDWWLGVVLFIPPLSAVGTLVSGIVAGESALVWSGVGTAVVVAGIYFGLMLPMRYELGEDALIVRSGLMRLTYPYAQLRCAVPTNTPISSPALSLDRLSIETLEGRRVVISPVERAEFLAELAKRSPQLTLEGDRLLSRA